MKQLIAILTVIFLYSSTTLASSINYQLATINGARVRVIDIDMKEKNTIGVVLSEGFPGTTETVDSMIRRARPAVAITGTFFCKRTFMPIGDIVINGESINFGGMGTAIAVTKDNQIKFVDIPLWRHVNWSGYQTVLASGPRLLKNGTLDVHPREQGFTDPNVLRPTPRLSVGYSQTGHLLMAFIGAKVSLHECAAIMKKLGAYNAINMDAGASTFIYYKGKKIINPARKLTNILVVYENISTALSVAAGLQPAKTTQPVAAGYQPTQKQKMVTATAVSNKTTLKISNKPKNKKNIKRIVQQPVAKVKQHISIQQPVKQPVDKIEAPTEEDLIDTASASETEILSETEIQPEQGIQPEQESPAEQEIQLIHSPEVKPAAVEPIDAVKTENRLKTEQETEPVAKPATETDELAESPIDWETDEFVFPQVPQENNPDYQYRHGLLMEEKNNLSNAIKAFQRAATLNPTAANYKALARCYDKVGMRNQAGSAYKMAADIYVKINLYDDAIINYNKAIEFQSENPAYYEALAKTYELKGNTDIANLKHSQAETLNFQMAMKLNPEEFIEPQLPVDADESEKEHLQTESEPKPAASQILQPPVFIGARDNNTYKETAIGFTLTIPDDWIMTPAPDERKIYLVAEGKPYYGALQVFGIYQNETAQQFEQRFIGGSYKYEIARSENNKINGADAIVEREPGVTELGAGADAIVGRELRFPPKQRGLEVLYEELINGNSVGSRYIYFKKDNLMFVLSLTTYAVHFADATKEFNKIVEAFKI